MVALYGKENLNLFEAFFEYANMGILVTDEEGVIVAVNPYALHEFGYSKNELANRKMESLISPRDRAQYQQNRELFVINPNNHPPGLNMELKAIKKDGSNFLAEIRFGYYHSNGRGYTIVFINDISSQRNSIIEIKKLKDELESKVALRTRDLVEAMHQLEISRDALQSLQSYQKALIDNAGAIIIATDLKGIIRLFNPEASLRTGYSEADVIDQYTVVIFHDKKEIERKRAMLLQEFGIAIEDDFGVLVEKAKRNLIEEEQYTFISKNGSCFPVLLTITSIRDAEHRVTGYMGIAIDISERKKKEEELRVLLQKEKELGELKSRFVSMASHEFRTPLSTILSSAFLIEKYVTADEQPKREKHLQRVVSSVNMLSDILNDFLSVGKIEEGKIQVRLTNFNLQVAVKEIAIEMKNNLKRGQKIHCNHHGPTNIELDASLMKHIIMNLVSNASKFSPEDSCIEINTSCNGHQITLSVVDHGIGISNSDQQHLMERFFRGANAGNIQGTGLGLHLVSRYAELMNGKVACISELEKGTTFTVNFNTSTDV